MKQIIFSGQYEFEGLYRQPSFCELTILQTPDRLLVVAKELANNPGTSITNAYPQLAEQIVETFELNPLTTFWLENYNYQSYPNRLGDLEATNRYTWVKLTWQFNEKRRKWQASLPEFIALREENYWNLLLLRG